MVQLSEPALLCMDSGSASRRRGYGQLTCRHDTPFSGVLLFLLYLSIEASKPLQKLPLRMFARQLGREKNLSVTTAGPSQKAPMFSFSLSF